MTAILDKYPYFFPGVGFAYHLNQNSKIKNERAELEKQFPILHDLYEGKLEVFLSDLPSLSATEKATLFTHLRKKDVTNSWGYMGSLVRAIASLTAIILLNPYIFIPGLFLLESTVHFLHSVRELMNYPQYTYNPEKSGMPTIRFGFNLILS